MILCSFHKVNPKISGNPVVVRHVTHQPWALHGRPWAFTWSSMKQHYSDNQFLSYFKLNQDNIKFSKKLWYEVILQGQYLRDANLKTMWS